MHERETQSAVANSYGASILFYPTAIYALKDLRNESEGCVESLDSEVVERTPLLHG
jgi:hypothetical protein